MFPVNYSLVLQPWNFSTSNDLQYMVNKFLLKENLKVTLPYNYQANTMIATVASMSQVSVLM